MFYYYGRKKALAGRYPEPLRGAPIVEPFGGSAAYSLHGERWRHDVTVCEIDPEIFELWRYLQDANHRDILALPDMHPGDRLDEHASLSGPERRLISLHIGPGKNRYNRVASKLCRWGAGRRYIADNLHKIKHWRIFGGSYLDASLPDRATWFVDPPYEQKGYPYRCPPVDYPRLAKWCRARRGLVIVCEQNGATWLPFRHLAVLHTTGKGKSRECVWIKRAGDKSVPAVSIRARVDLDALEAEEQEMCASAMDSQSKGQADE